MYFYGLSLLSVVLAATWDSNYNAYKSSDFSEGLIADLDRTISDYFEDLQTILLDLTQLETLRLPFTRINYDTSTALFEYTINEPIFHLKQNACLSLHLLEYSELTFTGDCSDLRLDEATTTTLHVERGIMHLKIQEQETAELFVPDYCVLYLTRIVREQLAHEKKRRQLLYSHRNNRGPELHGLTSTELKNFDAFDFITSIYHLPTLSFQSYAYPQAEFVFESDNEWYVIPQSIELEFAASHISRFEQDTVRIEFQSNCTDLESEITFEMFHDNPFVLTTRADCQLHVVRIQRTVKLNRHSASEKLLRYGDHEDLTLQMHLNEIFTPGLPVYVESLADLSDWRYLTRTGEYHVFGIPFSFWPYILPKNVPFVLHTTVDAEIDRKDLTLTFMASDCPVSLTVFTNGRNLKRSHPTIKGAVLSQDPHRVQVIVEPCLLNAQFQPNTAFILKSACDLTFIKAVWRVEAE